MNKSIKCSNDGILKHGFNPQGGLKPKKPKGGFQPTTSSKTPPKPPTGGSSVNK